MPLMHACFSIGTVIGAGVSAAATALDVPIVWHFLVLAVVIAGGVAISVRWVPHQPALGDDAPIHPVHADAPKQGLVARIKSGMAVWADRRLIFIGLVMLGMAFAEGSAGDWLAYAMVKGHGQSNAVGATVYGAFVVAMTLGRIGGGPLVDRIGRVASIRITASLTVVGLLMFILGDQLWIIVLGTLLWGLGASLGFPLGMSAAADDEKHAAARVSAVATIGYCAFLVGPPLIGFIGQAVGILAALFVVFALVVVSGLSAPALRTPEPAERAAS
jgi:MFS family permease